MARGTLFLVAGPSGAGKDTLMAGARAALSGDPRFVFARRVITRPADAGGEDHEAATEAEFVARAAAGGFLLSWRAHGWGYGLPVELAAELEAGRNVVANVSRAVVEDAAKRLAPVVLVEITAPRELRAARLAARGREDEADMLARLAREGAAPPPGVTVRRVVNDATPEDGIHRMVAALTDVADGVAQTCSG